MRNIKVNIPFVMLLIAITINSCAKDNDITTEMLNKKELSLNSFENLKGRLLNINNLNINNLRLNSRLEQSNVILSQVNAFYETDIDFHDSLKELTSSEEIFNWIKSNSDFNQNDIDILENFSSNLSSVSFEDAKVILEEEIFNADINSSKFIKYESILNTVALIEHQYPGYFTVTVNDSIRGCAWALAKMAFASAAMIAACNPPAMGATMATGCYYAATTFVAAAASVGMECGDD